MIASNVIDTAKILLVDPDSVYWSEAELIEYLNDGQHELVRVKPDALVYTQFVTLLAGPKQSLPVNGRFLIDVVRNQLVDGRGSRQTITAVEMRDMDRMAPGWQRERPSSTVMHYMYDRRNPDVFYVYPAQPDAGQGQVEIVYAANPDKVDTLLDDLDLGDEYQSPLLEFVLYRAHTKDTKESSPNRAIAHYQQFLQLLGVQSQKRIGESAGVMEQGALR